MCIKRTCAFVLYKMSVPFDDACVIHKKRELFASTRISAIKTKQRIIRKRKKKRHAKKISTSHTCFTMPCIYSLLYALTTTPYLRYCTLLSMKISQYIRIHSYVRPIYIRIDRLVGQKKIAHTTFYLVVHSIRSGHNEQYKQQNLIFFSGFVKPKH